MIRSLIIIISTKIKITNSTSIKSGRYAAAEGTIGSLAFMAHAARCVCARTIEREIYVDVCVSVFYRLVYARAHTKTLI